MSSHLMKGLAVSALAAALAGCGSDTGSGTETLYVEATASTDGSSNGTQLFVLVRDNSANGPTINDATVTMVGDRGTEHALAAINLGDLNLGYMKRDLAWEPGWRLRVERGADKLEAFLVAPGLTTLTEPTPGQVFGRAAQQNLRVRWRDESGRSAERVEISLDKADYDTSRPEDPGSHEIPYSTWTQAEQEERVTITRTNDINLAGGISGSTFKAVSSGRVDFVVQ